MPREETWKENAILENLYRHIITLEGHRNIFDDPDMLDAAADYLSEELASYGFSSNEHQFKIDEVVFRNIEGTIGGKNSEVNLLLCAHYDTANLSPGANDNASGVAAVLEIARALASRGVNKCVKVVFFTLEEMHPKLELLIRMALKRSGLVDEEWQYHSYHTFELITKFEEEQEAALKKGLTIIESLRLAYQNIKERATQKEKEYLKEIIKLNEKITRTNWIGKSICVGSSRWLANFLRENPPPKAAINFEEIGFTSNKQGSQSIIPGIDYKDCERYKVDLEAMAGNFLAIFSDKNSRFLGEQLSNQCKKPKANLPFVHFALPYTFNEIAKKALDFLRSDHAPFWREGIPAITLTDTFEFRYPFYHTSADTIEHLDFPFMGKVCHIGLDAIEALLQKPTIK